ncbi:MAG: ABC transporter ATP-binding protein [Acidobacteriota bacterium]
MYSRLLAEARAYWSSILLLAGVNLLATPIALLTPVPLKVAVDSIAGSAPLPGLYRWLLPDAVTHSVGGLVIVTAVLMVAIGALDELQSFAAWILETYTGERLVLDFRAKLFRHLQRLSLTYHDSHGTADSMYRLQSDAQAIQSIAVNGAMPFITSLITLVAMVSVIARLDTTLAVVALVASPLLFVVTRASVGQLKGSWKQVKQLESAALSVPQEVLGAIRVVKAFVREDHEEARFVERSRVRLAELLRVTVLQMKFDVTIALLIATTSAATLSLGILHVRAGTLSLGSLLLVIGYLGQLYAPLRTMSRKTSQLQSALAGAERALAVLDEQPEVVERTAARAVARAAGAIEFRGVGFAYGTDAPVLRDVSLQVPAGASVGIAGPTGAGKTTLLSLLTRFYDPTDGAILLDGIDLRDIRLRDLRRQFAIVQQEAVLFSTTVFENILYARPEATEADVEAAARAANAHDFIRGLPKGYDTVVGERGMRLSGGERQRIALARAFLKDAPILLLDEPTSAVDVGTESIIMDALTRLMAGRTTFLIAHRLGTLDHCEIRLTVEGGHVVRAAPRAPLAADPGQVTTAARA